MELSSGITIMEERQNFIILVEKFLHVEKYLLENIYCFKLLNSNKIKNNNLDYIKE